MRRYVVGCAGQFASGVGLRQFDDEDEAIAACGDGPPGCEVLDSVAKRWGGPASQEEIDCARARLRARAAAWRPSLGLAAGLLSPADLPALMPLALGPAPADDLRLSGAALAALVSAGAVAVSEPVFDGDVRVARLAGDPRTLEDGTREREARGMSTRRAAA